MTDLSGTRTGILSHFCTFVAEINEYTSMFGIFVNMVLRRIFGFKWDEVSGDWRRLHNEELNDLYSSPNIVRVLKSRRMRWAGHVAHMEEVEACTGLWC